MAKVRNTSGEALTVPGLGGFGAGRLVAPDEIVEIDDVEFDGYVYPNSAWESVEPPADQPQPDPPAPLYEHFGDDDIDTSAWPLADLVAEDGAPLYRFAGDTGADATGASDTWHVYTGQTKPASGGDL